MNRQWSEIHEKDGGPNCIVQHAMCVMTREIGSFETAVIAQLMYPLQCVPFRTRYENCQFTPKFVLRVHATIARLHAFELETVLGDCLKLELPWT